MGANKVYQRVFDIMHEEYADIPQDPPGLPYVNLRDFLGALEFREIYQDWLDARARATAEYLQFKFLQIDAGSKLTSISIDVVSEIERTKATAQRQATSRKPTAPQPPRPRRHLLRTSPRPPTPPPRTRPTHPPP